MDEGATKGDRMSRVYKRRQEQYITSMPSLFDYYCLIFHFPGIFGGPTLFYHEYDEVIGSDKYTNGFPKSRYLPALRMFVTGVVGLGLYVLANSYWPIDYFLTESFGAKPLVVRLVVFYVAMLGYRCRYFGMWKIGESICVVNGFGRKEVKDHETWDGCSNVDIVHFELASDFGKTVHYWNCRIQKWLQMCIYERSNFNQLYVYIVSAFWHGFYPAYYCAFGLASLMTVVGRMASKKFWPHVKGTWMEKPYVFGGIAMCNMVKTFMLGAFSCYSFEKTMRIWYQFDFFTPVVLLIGGAILLLLPNPVEVKKDCPVCWIQFRISARFGLSKRQRIVEVEKKGRFWSASCGKHNETPRKDDCGIISSL